MDVGTFQRVQRKSLSDAVFEQLRERILAGGFASGAVLPSERDLCEQLGVNRGALREALKRLQQAGLIEVRQGEPTRVLDYRRTGGLELLGALLFDAEGTVRTDVARSLIELRTALGPDIARLAARRRPSSVLPFLERVLDGMRRALKDDAVALQRLSLELWRLLVRASDNIAYQLAFNTMERGWIEVQDLLAPALLDEVSHLEGYEALARAVSRRQAEAARRAATELVERGARGAIAALELL